MFLIVFLIVFSPFVRAECVGPQKDWFCSRTFDLERYDSFRNTYEYGWLDGEARGSRDFHDLFAREYNHTQSVPILASGYKLMPLPEELNEIVEWYKKNRIFKTDHEIVPGNYLNDFDSPLHKLSLDLKENSYARNKIQNVVKPILANWIHRNPDDLRFTSLFGVREYHQNSFMLMHADRHTTHWVSAVIHLFQSNMKSGWPLAILNGNTITEVFCSKPCLILYVRSAIFF